jgi:hypothetical protein
MVDARTLEVLEGTIRIEVFTTEITFLYVTNIKNKNVPA